MDWLLTLRAAAREAKRRSMPMFREPESRESLGRGAGGDLTLKIDEASEQAIIGVLKERVHTSFEFIGEEVGKKFFGSNPSYVIVCDPIDGSHNAKIGLPFFAVSFAVFENGRTFSQAKVGYVENMATNDFFYALKGKGAFRNGKKIESAKNAGAAPTRTRKIIDTIGIEASDASHLKKILPKIGDDVNKVRVLGSAAIAMCFLADGTFDGLIFSSPNGARTLDSAAGYVIASEAGAVLTDDRGEKFEETEVSLESRTNIVGGTNSEIHRRLLQMLRAN